MNDLAGMILLPYQNHALQPLSNHRSLASIPFASKYCMIDFLLSSMAHSHIHHVSIFTHNHYRSLQDHVRNGRDWDLDRNQDGLFLFPLERDYRYQVDGDLSILYQHLHDLKKWKQQYVLLSFSCLIANIDFQPALQAHIDSGADITALYKSKQKGELAYLDVHIKNEQNILFQDEPSPYGLLDLFILDKKLLIRIVEKYAHQYRFFKDLLQNKNVELQINGVHYEGYARKVTTLQDYYSCSMELVNDAAMRKVFHSPFEVYTKIKDETPTVYASSAAVRNSLIANGCMIKGEVENSILFRGVHVKQGAVIKNSIVMQRCVINENAAVEKMMLDKEVTIERNVTLKAKEKVPGVVAKQAYVEDDWL